MFILFNVLLMVLVFLVFFVIIILYYLLFLLGFSFFLLLILFHSLMWFKKHFKKVTTINCLHLFSLKKKKKNPNVAVRVYLRNTVIE